MRGARRAYASRANAQKSTGPKTSAGKAIVARNAHRHGLSLPLHDDPVLSREIEDVARKIATPVIGRKPDGRQHALACRVAEAVIDLRRVGEAKLPLVADLECDPKNSAALNELVRLGRYEGRALGRRKRAVREFCAANLAPPHPDVAGSDPQQAAGRGPAAREPGPKDEIAQNKANWDNSNDSEG